MHFIEYVGQTGRRRCLTDGHFYYFKPEDNQLDSSSTMPQQQESTKNKKL